MKANKIILVVCLAAFVGSAVAYDQRSTSPLSEETQAELLRKGVVPVTQESITVREREMNRLQQVNDQLGAGRLAELESKIDELQKAAAKSYVTTAYEATAGVLRKPVCTVRGRELTVGKLAVAGVVTAGVVTASKSGKLSDLKAKLPSLPTSLFARK